MLLDPIWLIAAAAAEWTEPPSFPLAMTSANMGLRRWR